MARRNVAELAAPPTPTKRKYAAALRSGRGIAYLRALSGHCQLTYSGFGPGPRSGFVPTEEVSEQPGFRLKVSFDPCPKHKVGAFHDKRDAHRHDLHKGTGRRRTGA